MVLDSEQALRKLKSAQHYSTIKSKAVPIVNCFLNVFPEVLHIFLNRKIESYQSISHYNCFTLHCNTEMCGVARLLFFFIIVYTIINIAMQTDLKTLQKVKDP